MEYAECLNKYVESIYEILISSNLETQKAEKALESKNDMKEGLTYLKQCVEEQREFLENMIQGKKEAEVLEKGPLAELLYMLNEKIKDKMVEQQNKINFEKQLEQQVRYYQLMTEDGRRLNSFRHDTRNHYLCLDSLLMKGDIEGARNYIKKINTIISPEVNLIKTKNIVFDALVTDKLKEARDKGIEVEPVIMIPRTVKIENFDWCTLFGNSLDNAIEACERIDGKKKIWFQVRLKGRLLHAAIKNTALQPIKDGEFYKTIKKDTKQHGLGMRNIAEAVARYDGVIDTDFKDGIFTLIMLLCGV